MGSDLSDLGMWISEYLSSEPVRPGTQVATAVIMAFLGWGLGGSGGDDGALPAVYLALSYFY